MEKRAAEEETEADPEDMTVKEPQEEAPLRRRVSRARRRRAPWPSGHSEAEASKETARHVGLD